MSRYYIDRRPAAIALRDREADDDPPTFGPDAPGVISFQAATVGPDGHLRLDETTLTRQLSELLAGGAKDLAWASSRLAHNAAERNKRLAAAAAEARHRALNDWAHGLRAEAESALRAVGCGEIGHSWCDYTIYADMGETGTDTDNAICRGQQRLVCVEVNYSQGTVDWSLKRHGLEGLRALAAFAPRLEEILLQLEAICAKQLAARPVQP